MLSLQSDNRLHHHHQQQHQQHQLQQIPGGGVGYSRVLFEADRDDAFVIKSEPQHQQQHASGSHEGYLIKLV